jgi:hypothetical protein
VPEPQGAIGIVGREFDEWGGHGRKYGQRFALASALAQARLPIAPLGDVRSVDQEG